MPACSDDRERVNEASCSGSHANHVALVLLDCSPRSRQAPLLQSTRRTLLHVELCSTRLRCTRRSRAALPARPGPVPVCSTRLRCTHTALITREPTTPHPLSSTNHTAHALRLALSLQHTSVMDTQRHRVNDSIQKPPTEPPHLHSLSFS